MDEWRLEGHEHILVRVNHREGLECDACERSYGDAYSCEECKFTIHKKCTFVFKLQKKINHHCHDGHCLKFLTTGAPDRSDRKCHICGKNTKRLLYHCYTCNLNLDIDCIIDVRSNVNLPWHHHPLLMLDFWFDEYMECAVCGISFGNSYFCPRCRLMVHEKCVSLIDSPVITHPCHAKHSLKLLTEGAPVYTDPKCHLCGNDTGKFIYHCDICKFNLDLVCATENPPPAALSNLKVHAHTLTLMSRLISFVCDACGKKGDRAPYVCHQCDFMIHQNCAHLPRVIHVNHHDHRISFKYPLGLGEWQCGVCCEEIDWSHGAYSCSICPRYAIHSLCATRDDVWDGQELDGVPAKDENIEPFWRNDDNTISHFAHEHTLSLNKDGEESSLCGACVRPIGFDTFYNCSDSDCSFVLHETCANFLLKKRHFLSPRPLELELTRYDVEYTCSACVQPCCEGFMYSNDISGTFDLICSSIDVPFIHGSHPHPLLYFKIQYGQVKTCQSCDIDHTEVVIGCVKCNYFLDFRCATLPLTVRFPRYDDHLLTLCFGEEKVTGKYWCDICERETNPKTWFYTCKDCGVTLHILCVVGHIRYAKPGGKISKWVELLPNNKSTRPVCFNCHSRCPGPFIIKDSNKVMFFCSYYCFHCFRDGFYYWGYAMCPPWALRSGG